MLWNTLRSANLVDEDYQRDFGRLLPELKKAFRHPEVPDDLRLIARDVLGMTKKWHGYRSGLVHDLLTMGWGGRNDDVHSAVGRNPPRPMRQIAECASGLRAAGYRLRGLYIIAPHWLGAKVDGWDTADNLRSWTRVAMGHIADVPNTISGTDGPSPEPPGGWDAVVAQAVAAREAEDARLDAFVLDLEPDDEDEDDQPVLGKPSGDRAAGLPCRHDEEP